MGEKSTPAKTPSSTGKQQSILGFFSRASTQPKSNSATPTPNKTISASKGNKKSSCLKETTKSNSLSFAKRPVNITPVPSSDAVEPLSSQENLDAMVLDTKLSSDSLPFPSSPIEVEDKTPVAVKVLPNSSPSRKVKKAVNYAETSDDDEDEIIMPRQARQARNRTRGRAAIKDDDDDEDEYKGGNDDVLEDDDGGCNSEHPGPFAGPAGLGQVTTYP
ncbi:hypothetical protein VMCG_04876 [Cytospora schulzeri]|uniref:Uncharacterized protein n=1 Tax=Cytospora schulzeri TaxID=448051 RepID=A0A423WN24_9PEZI|nr:hypothetical protein VMCG_04876 [Valsa malicola]